MFKEYFGDWISVIDEGRLYKVLKTLSVGYSKMAISPAQEDIFKAFQLCPYKDLKVVMVGQDPYPQKGVATGVAFANKEGTKILSPSLELIQECIIDPHKYHNKVNFDITLESWAKQGVLLINSALTVEINKVGTHTMLWRPFISDLLYNISMRNSHVIFVLFGQTAQTFKPYIIGSSNILMYKHPAYFARLNQAFDCDAFDKINTILKNNNNFKINWYEDCFEENR